MTCIRTLTAVFALVLASLAFAQPVNAQLGDTRQKARELRAELVDKTYVVRVKGGMLAMYLGKNRRASISIIVRDGKGKKHALKMKPSPWHVQYWGTRGAYVACIKTIKANRNQTFRRNSIANYCEKVDILKRGQVYDGDRFKLKGAGDEAALLRLL